MIQVNDVSTDNNTLSLTHVQKLPDVCIIAEPNGEEIHISEESNGYPLFAFEAREQAYLIKGDKTMANTYTLKWDQAGKRELEAGVSKVVLFPITDGVYGDGVAWSGITAFNENPGGADANDLYADNIEYASMRAAETYGFSIEAYMYPPEWAECDGSAQVEGVEGLFIGQQNRKAFGLVVRTEVGDDQHPGMNKGYKLHFIFNATASPSGRGYATINDNPDAISFSWDCNSNSVAFEANSGYKPCCTMTVDSTKMTSTAKLEALEQIIYGDGTKAAKMLTPDELIAALS